MGTRSRRDRFLVGLTVCVSGIALQAALGASAHAVETVQLTPQIDCTIDNTGSAFDCAEPSLNAGICDTPYCTRYEARALIRWDLRSIPHGSQILSATLQTTPTNTDTWVSQPVAARPALQAWSSQVDWTMRDGQNPWAAPGGDFGAAVDAAVPCCGQQEWDLTSLVNEWVNGQRPNRGLGLVGTAPETDNALGVGINSMEAAYGPPLLTVTYNAPAPAVLNVKVYVDDPSIPLTQLGEEWRVVGSVEERWVDDDAITTLSPVACSVSPTGRCLEYRQRSRHSEVAPSESDGFVRYRGTSETDARVPRSVGELMRWVDDARDDAVDGTGAIGSVKFAWQTLPPGAGTTYDLYESEIGTAEDGGTAVDGPAGEVDTPVVREYRKRLVVDSATGLPLRWTVFKVASGELVARRIFSYAAALIPRAQFPADFFTVARPASPDSEKVVEFMDGPPEGGGTLAASSTARHGARLSPSAQVGGRGLCFHSAEAMSLTEQPLPSEVPKPDGSHREALEVEAVYARYRARDAAGRCRTGPPSVALRSTKATGRLADLWRQSYIELGSPTQLPPRLSRDRSVTPIDVRGKDTVWLLDLQSGRTGFYAEKEDAALVVTGPLSAADVHELLQEVEVR